MEDEESVREILNELVKTQGTCLCLDSLDLEDIPGRCFTQLAPKVNLTVLKLEYNNLVTLPDEIGMLSLLEELYLNGNQLVGLPSTIGEIKGLQQLHMNENCIQTLPETFGQLQNLQVLNLIGNQLETWNESFGEGLRSLTELRIGENCLKFLPETFTRLQCLEILEINENNLKKLPKLIGELSELQVLNLNQNQIEDLPESFGQFQSLYSVDISQNRVSALSSEFKSAETLQYFYAVNNLIKVLPSWFSKLHNIIELNLSENELIDMALPPEFCLASGQTLVSLDLSGNKMTKLPETMGELKYVTTFHLGSTICEIERRAFQNGNWLRELPETFTQMSCLTTLHLDENILIGLPDSFGDLVRIEWLDLSQNRIYQLPESFCSLKKLWFCQFSENNLTELPENFGDLTSLVELRIDCNNLTALPGSFEKLQSLKILDLFHNKLEEIPKVLLKLKNLHRLDLDGNNLKIRDDKIPNLTTSVRYAPRNPELQANWRRNPRVDKKDFYGQQVHEENISSLIEKAELEGKLEYENVESTEEGNIFSERALEMAMRRGLSIWRSHTGPETRQENSDYVKYLQASPIPEETFTFQPYHHYSSIFEDATTQEEIPKSLQEENVTLTSSVAHDSTEHSEDWDREVDENWTDTNFTPVGLNNRHQAQHVPIRDEVQHLISSYLPARQAFTQSAKYDSVYLKYHKPNDPGKTITGTKTTEVDSTEQFEDAEI